MTDEMKSVLNALKAKLAQSGDLPGVCPTCGESVEYCDRCYDRLHDNDIKSWTAEGLFCDRCFRLLNNRRPCGDSSVFLGGDDDGDND